MNRAICYNFMLLNHDELSAQGEDQNLSHVLGTRVHGRSRF